MTKASGAIIRLHNVGKSYQRGSDEVAVLDRLTLEIGSGAFEAIMGPSGSGKTTLLNLIGGIDRPTSGSVVVADTDISSSSEDSLASWRLRNIGFIFQFYNLLQPLSAFQNIELPLRRTSLSKKERRERVHTALELVGLAHRANHYPRQLSAGQEQRVAIARALVTDPAIIIADEPTGDLDSASADDVLNLMALLHQKFSKTIVMVTHDPIAAEAAESVRYLDKGKLASSPN